MLEASVFNEDSMKSFLQQNYHLEVFRVEVLNRGSANLFSLNDNQYILKEYQSRYDVESIKREVEVIRHLRHKNMPVPAFLPNVRSRRIYRRRSEK